MLQTAHCCANGVIFANYRVATGLRAYVTCRHVKYVPFSIPVPTHPALKFYTVVVSMHV